MLINSITNICPLNETLLRMLSLDLLDKVAKRLDFHSATILLLDFFDKDQTSLNITRLHSTHSTRWPNGSIFSSIFQFLLRCYWALAPAPVSIYQVISLKLKLGQGNTLHACASEHIHTQPHKANSMSYVLSASKHICKA